MKVVVSIQGSIGCKPTAIPANPPVKISFGMIKQLTANATIKFPININNMFFLTTPF